MALDETQEVALAQLNERLREVGTALPITPELYATVEAACRVIAGEPRIGSIVWYASEEQREPCAAIVVGKDLAWQQSDAGPKLDLLVITEDGAFRWAQGVDRGTEPGEWRWPE